MEGRGEYIISYRCLSINYRQQCTASSKHPATMGQVHCLDQSMPHNDKTNTNSHTNLAVGVKLVLLLRGPDNATDSNYRQKCTASSKHPATI